MNAKLLLILLLLSAYTTAQSYTESNLVTFPPFKDGPSTVRGGLIIDSSGNLYGAAGGGSHSDGTIFKVSPAGSVTTIYNFIGGNNGSQPVAGVVRDSAGNFYGTTSGGGASGGGVVFKVTPSGKETVLYSFPTGTFESFPVAVDSSGNVYGYSYNHNQSYGLMFEITPTGSYSVLYNFCSLPNCADGSLPTGSPIIDKSGNLYGTASAGGDFNYGVVFTVSAQHVYSVLYSFVGVADSGTPIGKLTQVASGLMYGCASGDDSGTSGAIFTITSSGAFSTVYSFTGGVDGYGPVGPLISDSSGNVYGVTVNYSSFDAGAVLFEISPEGAETTIYTAGEAGAIPEIAMDKSGDFYGETYFGGPKHLGTIYKLTKDK